MPFIQRSPLSYQPNTTVPFRRYETTRAPANTDYRNFIQGDFWLDTSSDDWYICCQRTGSAAIWRKLAGTAAAIEGHLTDDGNTTYPDALNVLDILGNTGTYLNGMYFTGDPANNTISARDLRNTTKYVVDSTALETEYQTIQAALNAANAAGVDTTVYVRPGTYTEDLTLYSGITIEGGSVETLIVGNHTPPTTGTFTFLNILLSAPTGDIFSSAAAGTCILICDDCYIIVTNGYIYDLPNWTGFLTLVGCTGLSVNDGIINNTGGAQVLISNCNVGAGVGNTCIISNSTIDIISSQIGCPITLGGTSNVIINEGSSILGTFTTAGTATCDITHTKLVTGANAAISHGSANPLTLSNITINSSNATPIQGAGAGVVTLGGIDFIQNSAIAGTITQAYTRTTNRISPYIVGATGNFETIQEAVTTAETIGTPATIYVQPGTYTETITHGANNLTLIAVGKAGDCIITQADANVINFANFTGIKYVGFRIQVTAATTAINTVQGTTGTATFKECQLRMTSAAAIVAVNQPAIGELTGAGTLNIRFGRHQYLHTGVCGGAAQKGAFRVANGGLIHIGRVEDFTIVNSGTALVSAVGVDLASTGNFEMHSNNIDITDPNATNVVGLAYLGGTGTLHEFDRNNIHITATANTGYGFFAADTASISRFYYNHIHVSDVGGLSYSFYVGNTATVISHFDDIVADDGVNLIAGGIFYEVSSEINGNLTLEGPTVGGSRLLTVQNTDNTSLTSNTVVNMTVGGTAGGDPFAYFNIPLGSEYSWGIDNSDADNFKLTDGASPSLGTTLFQMTPAGVPSFPTAPLGVPSGGTGVNTITDHVIIVGSGVNPITEIGPLTNGQLVIGSTGVAPVAATLTAGAGITIANAAGSITISAGGGGFTWTEVTIAGPTAMSVANGYIANAAVVVNLTLPAAGNQGDVIQILGKGAGGWQIQQNAGQTIHFNALSTTTGVGGSVSSTQRYNCVEIICITTNTDWIINDASGNLTIV
jgi:hypothetical protein